MKATEILELEHRTIVKVAEACGVIATQLQLGKKLPASVLESLVEFLRVYGRQYHDAEERWLFTLLRQKGIPKDSFLIARLNRDDDKLAGLVNELTAAVQVYVKTEGTITSTLVDALAQLGRLYPDHISAEDQFLLPLADELLSATDQQALAEMFHIVEAAKGEQARHTIKRLSTAIKMCPECGPEREKSHVA